MPPAAITAGTPSRSGLFFRISSITRASFARARTDARLPPSVLRREEALLERVRAGATRTRGEEKPRKRGRGRGRGRIRSLRGVRPRGRPGDGDRGDGDVGRGAGRRAASLAGARGGASRAGRERGADGISCEIAAGPGVCAVSASAAASRRSLSGRPRWLSAPGDVGGEGSAAAGSFRDLVFARTDVARAPAGDAAAAVFASRDEVAGVFSPGVLRPRSRPREGVGAAAVREGAAEPAASARLAATAGRATGEVPLAPGPPAGRVLEADEGARTAPGARRDATRAGGAGATAPRRRRRTRRGPERAEDSRRRRRDRRGAPRRWGGGLPNVPAVEPRTRLSGPCEGRTRRTCSTSARAPRVADGGGGGGRRRRERREPRRATVPKRHFETRLSSRRVVRH